MNGEKCKLEGDDWILIDENLHTSKGDEGEFIFVSPEKWSPDIRDCVLLVPSIDFYKTLIGSMSVENALKQLEIDFPRQDYSINSSKTSFHSMCQEFKKIQSDDLLSAILCSTQAVLAMPFIWISTQLQNHNYILTDLSQSRTSIEWYIDTTDRSCRVDKKLRLITINSNTGEEETTHLINVSLECGFSTSRHRVLCYIQTIPNKLD